MRQRSAWKVRKASCWLYADSLRLPRKIWGKNHHREEFSLASTVGDGTKTMTEMSICKSSGKSTRDLFIGRCRSVVCIELDKIFCLSASFLPLWHRWNKKLSNEQLQERYAPNTWSVYGSIVVIEAATPGNCETNLYETYTPETMTTRDPS